MRLANGLPWSLPITLSVTAAEAAELKSGMEVALTQETGLPLAILKIDEIYPFDKEKEAVAAYGTNDASHPGVAYTQTLGDFYLGGKIEMLRRSPIQRFHEHQMDPAQTRKLFEEKGWKRIVAFQTRNPIHRAHEYIQKCALEITDGLLLHPIVGETKSDDVPADVRMRCYKVLLENYYPKDRTILAVFPAAMRYAGPKEAIFHAICRKNYGVTHFIVGRDHAGVGNFYGSFDAHHIFNKFTPTKSSASNRSSSTTPSTASAVWGWSRPRPARTIRRNTSPSPGRRSAKCSAAGSSLPPSSAAPRSPRF
ncbi:MAG: hypothetical protein MPW15_00715 [Candidatus Manganitrophus sp.]|nr:hypothetical protein [Candidatus Manganitrophus sp.]